MLRNPCSASKNLRILARRACHRRSRRSLTRQPAEARPRASQRLTRQPAEVLPSNASARRGFSTQRDSPPSSSPPKSPVSNTSARRGPGRNRASETSLRRAKQRLSHLTMGSRYQSKTALFGPKTRSSTMSPLRHRSLFGAEKCAMEKRVLWRVRVLVAREVELRVISPQSHSSQYACLGKVGSGLVMWPRCPKRF